MSPVLQNSLSQSSYRIKFYSPKASTFSNPSRTPKSSVSYNSSVPPTSQTFVNNRYPLQKNLSSFRRCYWRIKAYDSSTATYEEYERPDKQFNFDAILYLLESLCVISSAIVSVGCVVNWVFFRQQNLGLLALGNRILVVLLAGAVAIGSVIRRRQWRRVCGLPPSKSELGGNGNVIERIEKLEESMKSATTIIRMLSRQTEKLGVRFRLHKKALKEPIAETAALAQKNSEATRALAEQESILEKELGEVQNVLLAMQDQQQKQLELILAIAKSGKLFDTKQEGPSKGAVLNAKDSANKGLRQVDGQQIQAIPGQKVATNDIA